MTFVYGEVFSEGITRKNLRTYGVARFSRIYPLYFVMLFVMLGAYAVASRAGVAPHETSGYNLESLILSLFLVQEWFGVVSPNFVSWSISVEFASYLIFPLLIARVVRLPRYWPLLAVVGGAIIVQVFADIRTIRGVAEFMMGCAAYTASRQYNAGPASALAGIALIIPFFASAAIGSAVSGLAAICFTATVFFLASPNAYDPFARLCAARPVVFIGIISYSVYLIQWFVWIGWKHVIARVPFFSDHLYLMAACAAASVILCAVGSFYLFESPTRSWLRRHLGATCSVAFG
jgi:peptidoglycan/LPS O-acetylase OafA/YrhL